MIHHVIFVSVIRFNYKKAYGIFINSHLNFNMKAALVFLTLVALGSSAPQPRKLFHEHFDDFIEIIQNEVISELNELVAQYSESEEFQKTVQYVMTSDFKELIYEMEALPEFKAVSIL